MSISNPTEAWSGLIDLEAGETLQPLGNNVFIRRDEQDDKIGLLFVPDVAKRKQQHGTVIAVGPGKTNKFGTFIPTEVKVGDRVVFDGYVAREFAKDRNLVQLAENEILGIVEGEGT
jgi:chaperonin GroES